MESRMNRVLIESIGLEDNNPQSSVSQSIIFTSSVVLSIFENSFPHYVEFNLMEPITKSEWSHQITTNAVSSMMLKEKFIQIIYNNIKEGPHRKWTTSNFVEIPTLAYENMDMFALGQGSFAASVVNDETSNISPSNCYYCK